MFVQLFLYECELIATLIVSLAACVTEVASEEFRE